MKKGIVAILLVLLTLLQYKLWFGDGGLIRVWQLTQAVETQQKQNEELKERNDALEAEVIDLKKGVEAIEERARSDLGMIKEGETFFQIAPRAETPQ
jgi:cell division protein FtsB